MLSAEDIKRLEDELLKNPEKGDMEDNAGGVRKVRAAIGEQGKSGSARVAYLYIQKQQKIYFILSFSKSVQGVLTEDQKKELRKLAAQSKQGER